MAAKIIVRNARRSGLTGIVEENNGCIYLYAYERGSGSVVGTCWICNTKKATRIIKYELMEKGKQPRMSAVYCDHPKGMKVNADALTLQWSSDGDILVLREGGKVLGLITNLTKKISTPYSLHVTGETPFARSLAALPESVKELVQLDKVVETDESDVEAAKPKKERKERKAADGDGGEAAKPKKEKKVRVKKEKKQSDDGEHEDDVKEQADDGKHTDDVKEQADDDATDGKKREESATDTNTAGSTTEHTDATESLDNETPSTK